MARAAGPRDDTPRARRYRALGAGSRPTPGTGCRPIRPEYLTHRFNTLVKEFGLPPIRLHNLRHGAATLALASHTDLKVIQQMLGHSSIVTTADTYTSVLPETAHRAAQATADMVIKAARSAPGPRLSGTIMPHVPAAVTASGYCQM